MHEFREVRLSGVTFGNCQENIRKWGRKETGSYSLVREPENSYDKNAIKVFYGEDELGYVPAKTAAKLAPLMDTGKRFKAEFVQQNTSSFSDVVGLTVNLVETSLQGITEKGLPLSGGAHKRLKRRPSKLFNSLRRQKISIKERKRL